MYEWVISYETDETLEEILKIGTVEFEPIFPHLKFIIMKSYLSKETIMNIKGVTECREPWIGSFN
jgi:hypothetical protein